MAFNFFVPDSSTFLPPSHPEDCRETGNGNCSRFITPHCFCSFLLTCFLCSTMCPFYGLQSLRKRLLLKRFIVDFPHVSLALPENLLLHGLVSMRCGSCWEPAPAWALPGLQFPSGISCICCRTRSSMGCRGDNLLHHGLLCRLQGNLCSGAWSSSSPSFLTDLGVCRAVSCTFLSLLTLTAAVQHFSYVMT